MPCGRGGCGRSKESRRLCRGHNLYAKSESVQILQAISGPGNIMWEIWRVSEREVGGEVI